MIESPITVALVEDDPGMQARLSRVISANPQLQLAHAAGTAKAFLQWLTDNPVAVALVDLGLPDQSGLEVIRSCRRLQPACEVMVITIFGDESNMLRAFEAGARGYLLKDGTEEGLAQHVLNLHHGGSPMSPVIARQLLMRWHAKPGTPATSTVDADSARGIEAISPRELDVLDLVARGFTYKETGTQLGIAVTTVHAHVRNIYGKLDVHNKAEAIYEARKIGWLPG
jgi:DNA-binding NarL/FixJ family response regulator